MFNRSSLLIVAAAVFAGLGLLAAQQWIERGPQHSAPALETVIPFATPRPIPPFELVSAAGPVTEASLRGRWTVVFIGFVSCPDICPTTLTDMAKAQRAWAALPEAQRPRLLFVSIDPERDTPELIAGYARHFHPETVAATQPDLARLETFTNSLSLVFRKVPLGDTYTMDHSSSMVVLDPEVRVAGVIRPRLPEGATPGSGAIPVIDAEAVARDLAALAGAGA
ncbi:SCO family protein [Silanimonas sp.]|uniref:SCO family protein n=1 Tax=Silanimonas sp. TaxID=1929290 RepID=UPI001BC237EA|nr:SCO family protein [Silanimonas sp.]MBS3895725.1 SCO family protein [Silanimonas sp.]MBS3924356.1 SCO family protein [Xanthomonadaceae bacterium]MBS3924765.1 SCO family protein [Xanthomonadaceae bacterium]